MAFGHGEGELEIENQGRFKKSRFSQETVAIGQQTPRNGEQRPKLRFAQRVSSAERTWSSDSTPQSFSSEKFKLASFSFEGEISREEFFKGTQATQSMIAEVLKSAGKKNEGSKL